MRSTRKKSRNKWKRTNRSVKTKKNLNLGKSKMTLIRQLLLTQKLKKRKNLQRVRKTKIKIKIRKKNPETYDSRKIKMYFSWWVLSFWIVLFPPPSFILFCLSVTLISLGERQKRKLVGGYKKERLAIKNKMNRKNRRWLLCFSYFIFIGEVLFLFVLSAWVFFRPLTDRR